MQTGILSVANALLLLRLYLAKFLRQLLPYVSVCFHGPCQHSKQCYTESHTRRHGKTDGSILMSAPDIKALSFSPSIYGVIFFLPNSTLRIQVHGQIFGFSWLVKTFPLHAISHQRTHSLHETICQRTPVYDVITFTRIFGSLWVVTLDCQKHSFYTQSHVHTKEHSH